MRRFLLVPLIALSAVLMAGCNPLESKQKAGLQVITNNEPSTLFLNGQYLDKTPYINKEIKPGEYTLRIQPDNPSLVAHETTVTLRKGVLTVVTWKPATLAELSGGVVYEMERLEGRSRTELSFVTIPDNAIISLDGQTNKVFSPIVLSDVAPGEHTFEVALPSYESQKHTINVVAGYGITATIKLAKNTAGTPAQPSSTSTKPSPSAVPTSSASSSAKTASPSAKVATTSALPRVTIRKTNYFVGGKEVLRVRAEASNGSREIGQAPVGSQYPYKEKTAGWVSIDFNGVIGWVSSTYATVEE